MLCAKITSSFTLQCTLRHHYRHWENFRPQEIRQHHTSIWVVLVICFNWSMLVEFTAQNNVFFESIGRSVVRIVEHLLTDFPWNCKALKENLARRCWAASAIASKASSQSRPCRFCPTWPSFSMTSRTCLAPKDFAGNVGQKVGEVSQFRRRHHQRT